MNIATPTEIATEKQVWPLKQERILRPHHKFEYPNEDYVQIFHELTTSEISTGGKIPLPDLLGCEEKI